ncbi:hypothetical protein [Streptomyces sp. NBC_01276]|uniref:hypothetical protein n=1 Tax=Streptomyces sp. NBC_01276 TaxID=2903808 RepID=UPI00352CC502
MPLHSDTGAPGTESGASLLQDALWAHAAPHHALEHARVRPAPHGLHVALFVRAENTAAATAKAHDLLTLALATGAARGYTPDPLIHH